MAIRSMISLCFALLPAAQAWSSDSVDGRFGRTEIRYVAGKPVVFHKGQKVLIINEADGASIVRVLSETNQDYLAIESRKPGARCQQSYRLLSIPDKGPVQATAEIGECAKLAGISFAGAYPVVHLKNPATSGIEQLMWKDGKPIQLPPSTAQCYASHEQAATKSSRIQPPQATYTANGEGRLQFLSAPDERCAIPGTFVVHGDSLLASRVYGRYTQVYYQNPKSEKVAAGWVDSARIKPSL